MSERTCSYHDRRRRLRCTECNLTLDLCQCVEVEELAYQRLASDAGQFLRAVLAEVQNALPVDHLFERVSEQLGTLGMKIVKNDLNREVSDQEIRREIVYLVANLTILATKGTPEYAYPSD